MRKYFYVAAALALAGLGLAVSQAQAANCYATCQTHGNRTDCFRYCR